MGQSEILESSSKGNWATELHLTESEQDDSQIDLFVDKIEKYSLDQEKFNNQTTNESPLNKIQNEYVFDLMVFDKKFDVQSKKRFSKKVQKWKGIVLSIKQNYFTVKLFDLTNPSNSYELGELETDDISPEDKPLLKIGAIFYWTVGHFMENGQVVKKSILRFQRLITLDNFELEEIFKDVEDQLATLKEEKIDF